MMQTATPSPTHVPLHSFARPARLAQPLVVLPSRRARQLSPEQGRAIEKLAHAIEYLSDELAMQCMTARAHAFDPQPTLAAIEMLKQCNREIYLACPQVPTLGERVRALFGRA